MAYGDYGGYGFRNSQHILQRSDCTISPDGDEFGNPGMWPGFALMMANLPHDEVQRRLSEQPNGHVVLGDGPIYVVLYKQSTIQIWRGSERLDLVPLLTDAPTNAIAEYQGAIYVNQDIFRDSQLAKFSVDGWLIEVMWTEEDNFYQYVQVTQPDGTFWHGWSGFGVGAGLEDCGYGYSTEDRTDKLAEIFRDFRPVSAG